MNDALSDLETQWRAAGLTTRLNPSVYGDGLLVYESVDGPQGLKILHDAVFIFTESELWGAWWPSLAHKRPDPQYATFADVVAAVSSKNQWSIALP